LGLKDGKNLREVIEARLGTTVQAACFRKMNVKKSRGVK
jgi:hypothetical protein